jgi:hypothetical protein
VFQLVRLLCHWLVGRVGRHGKVNHYRLLMWQERAVSGAERGESCCEAKGLLNTAVPPFPLIQYLWFQLSVVYHDLKKNWKIKELSGS